MTDLERRALLGDKQAQEECTGKGILLPCPFCGGAAYVKTQKQDYGFSGTYVTCLWCRARVYCFDKHAHITENGIKNIPVNNHKLIAIKMWNTRPASPIGRCKDCQYSGERDENGYSICQSTGSGVAKTDFCSEFQPKGK